MTFSAVHLLLVGPVDRHHARATSCNMWMIHWGKCDTCLIIDFTLPDIRTVQNVIIIVKAHQPVLLLSYLILLEVRTTFTFIALHLTPYIVSLILHEVRLGDVSITGRIRRIQPLAHTVVLWHIPSLFWCTALDSVSIILLTLCAILRIWLILEMPLQSETVPIGVFWTICKLNLILI